MRILKTLSTVCLRFRFWYFFSLKSESKIEFILDRKFTWKQFKTSVCFFFQQIIVGWNNQKNTDMAFKLRVKQRVIALDQSEQRDSTMHRISPRHCPSNSGRKNPKRGSGTTCESTGSYRIPHRVVRSCTVRYGTSYPVAHPLAKTNGDDIQRIFVLLNIVTKKTTKIHSSKLKIFHFDPARNEPMDSARCDYMEYYIEVTIAHKGNTRKVSTLNSGSNGWTSATSTKMERSVIDEPAPRVRQGQRTQGACST